MGLRIEWSELAERQLKDIFDFYAIEVSPHIAKKIIKRIIERVSILENNPLIGTKEELLINNPEDYRYLVESNYKIIYWRKGKIITVASVFDCRQNPDRIINL
jgi:plasmid stabilization system protein ParE